VTLKQMLESMLVIQVHNANSYLPAGQIPRIFEQGFSTKPGHAGIGMDTVQRLAAKYRGHVDVESGPDTGTTFVVFIPIGKRG
jgi:sensor histidine kinase regulating citrate/malate metabolism